MVASGFLTTAPRARHFTDHQHGAEARVTGPVDLTNWAGPFLELHGDDESYSHMSHDASTGDRGVLGI